MFFVKSFLQEDYGFPMFEPVLEAIGCVKLEELQYFLWTQEAKGLGIPISFSLHFVYSLWGCPMVCGD